MQTVGLKAEKAGNFGRGPMLKKGRNFPDQRFLEFNSEASDQNRTTKSKTILAFSVKSVIKVEHFSKQVL